MKKSGGGPEMRLKGPNVHFAGGSSAGLERDRLALFELWHYLNKEV